MMNLHASLLAVVLATQALAQNEIKMYAWTLPASRPGTPTAQFNAGADITVTVGASVNMVQFVADTGTSTDTATYSIGHITIRRSSSATDELRVLIAGTDESNLPGQPDDAISAGCLHWAGIHGEDSDTSDADEDSVTGRALIVAAAINGNFMQGSSADGRIEAGHIYRLQSQSDVTGSGNLAIPVWGYGPHTKPVKRSAPSESIRIAHAPEQAVDPARSGTDPEGRTTLPLQLFLTIPR